VFAVRFFLILAVTWTLTGLSAKPQLAATFPPALFSSSASQPAAAAADPSQAARTR
jgi:hypothetical protein